jgi:hypothetical protein
MREREKRCNAIGHRLAAAPVEQWDRLIVVFDEEGFSADEVAQAIEANVYAALLGFLRHLEPRALRAAAAAQMLKNIGDHLREQEDVKGGHDA